MGNQMCKDRSETTHKSPIDRVLKCGNVMCPTPFNRKPQQKHWKKRVIQTKSSSPERPKPSNIINSGWRSATLSVPKENTDPVIKSASIDTVDAPLAPVPPPRKKRAATLQRETRIKNGFKDVFGITDQRRHSLDNVGLDDMHMEHKLHIRPKSEFSIESIRSEDFADFSKDLQAAMDDTDEPKRRISKVGNKKSDKFLGENLSDSLSDEPYFHASSDDADTVVRMSPLSLSFTTFKKLPTYEKESEKIEASQQKEEPPVNDTSRSSLDKKAEFLMTMLTNYNDDHKYHGREPVEEPLIVPKRKVRKHICDDSDHFRKHEQAVEECEHSENRPGPRKPDRDLDKYRRSLDALEMEATIDREKLVALNEQQQQPISILRPVRPKKLSRDNLPSPPPRPKRQNSTESTMVTSTPLKKKNSDAIEANAIVSDNLETNKTIQRIISMPRFDGDGKVEVTEKVEVLLKKCKSSNSFLTQELMSELLKSKYGFEHWPEDYGSLNHDDGSKNVAPTSKLKIRRVSSTQRILQEQNSHSPTIAEEDGEQGRTRFTIGNREVVIPPKLALSPVRHISFSDQVPKTVADKREQNESIPIISPIAVPQISMTLSEVRTSPLSNRDHLMNPFFDSEMLQRLVDESPDLNIHNVVKDILDNKGSVVKEFQQYLEEELNSPQVVEKFVTQKQGNTSLERSVSQVPNESVLDTTLYQTARSDTGSRDGDSEQSASSSDADSTTLSDIDECFDKEFKNLEKDGNQTSNGLLGKYRPRLADDRRESIEVVDPWFTKHLETVEAKSSTFVDDAEEENTNAKPIGFPFDRIIRPQIRRDSESSEFFENANSTLPSNVQITTVEMHNTSNEDHSKFLNNVQKYKDDNKNQVQAKVAKEDYIPVVK